MKQLEWHNLSLNKILKELNSSKIGLSEKEAKKRIKKFGKNKLPEKKKLNPLLILMIQFKNPLIYILIFAALITLVLREFTDLIVILSAILINTVIGFVQEYKADKTLLALKKSLVLKAKVIRNGIEKQILAEDLVPGDLIIIEAGDKVPADGRVLKSIQLEVIEAPLTGESIPSVKSSKILPLGTPLADRENMVYMGTEVSKGKGIAIVTATGVFTEIGKIAKALKEIRKEKTPLQKRLAEFSTLLGMLLVVITLIIFIVGVLKGINFLEMLLISVVLAVAAVPEGLPAAVTVVLALGMQKIFKKKGLVRRLIAAETLGSTTVICTDKTGTLTEGKMVVDHLIPFKKDHLLMLKIGILCNNATIENPQEELRNWRLIGDPTEKALLLAGIQAGLDKFKLEKEYPRIGEIPFEEKRKFMATFHKIKKDKIMVFVKGAPEVILSLSNLDSKRKRKAEVELKKLTQKGLRVLGFAEKEFKNKKIQENSIRDLEFVGLIGLKDPLRKEAKATINLTREAGIKPIIVTGDHRLTAKAIAQELGFPAKEENILEGKEIDKFSDKELKERLKKVSIFARVEPIHKLRIIDLLQEEKQVVAMTGDGVNDAPALKSADIGVALGSGTDVAKEASDIVLLDDNLKILISAIEQGRIIFDNIKKVTLYLLSSSFTEVLLVAGSVLLGLPFPVLPAQILWVNLIEDGLPDFALAFEPGEKEVMKEPPRPLKAPILDKEMKILIFIIGIFTDLLLFGIFYWLLSKNLNLPYIRTFIFAGLAIDSLCYVFSCRSLRFTIFHKNPFSNKFLIFSVGLGFLMLFSGIYFPPFQKILRTVPLDLKDWILIFAFGIINVVLIELVKWVFIIKRNKSSNEIDN